METWLVTGGAGFIGHNFINMVLRFRSDVNIVLYDSLTYANSFHEFRQLIEENKLQFIQADITDKITLFRTICDFHVDKIIHFAAETHVDRSIHDPRLFIETNIFGTFTLLECLREYRERESRDCLLLHVSTDEVFGSLNPDDPPFNERSPYHPNSPYSASKASSDHLARAWYHTYGLNIIITNCSNNYGPWQYPEKLIPSMILKAMHEQPLPIYGNGQQIRDWLHVDDHCRALLTVLEKGTAGSTYVIGGNNERTNLEIVQAICDSIDFLKKKEKGFTRKLIRFVADRPGHDIRYAIDYSKISEELGWRPQEKFEESLPFLIQWYSEQDSWKSTLQRSLT